MLMRTLAACSLLLVLLAGCTAPSSENPTTPAGDKPAAEGGAKKRIAFIPKGATHEFWKTMQAGAEATAKEQGIELIWKSPLKEDDRAEQVKVVENFINEKVDGIVLAPLDENALSGPAKEAVAAGIPVLIVDSAIKGMEPVSFIATDNYAAGSICAEQMSKALGGKGKVLVLRYQEGSASTMAREQGFLDKAKELGIEIASSEQYGGATRESAQTASENLIQRFAEGGGLSVAGIFTPNESTTFGMMRALESAGLLGKVKLVGFDSSKELLEGVTKGQIYGLLLQNPYKMGQLGVKTMMDHLNHQKVQAKVDSGSVFLTKENMETDEVKALLPKN